jgi:hypothetical protein
MAVLWPYSQMQAWTGSHEKCSNSARGPERGSALIALCEDSGHAPTRTELDVRSCCAFPSRRAAPGFARSPFNSVALLTSLLKGFGALSREGQNSLMDRVTIFPTSACGPITCGSSFPKSPVSRQCPGRRQHYQDPGTRRTIRRFPST